MKTTIVLLLLIQFNFSFKILAQKNYSAGYIISLKGDTIKGLVKDRDPGAFGVLYAGVKFIENNTKGSEKFSASEILGYSLEGAVFRSVRFREESSPFKVRYFTDLNAPRVFLKVVAETDHIVYYAREFTYDDNFETDNFPLLHIRGTYEMVRVTQGIFGLARNRLANYFRDCPALVDAIKNKRVNTASGIFDFYNKSCVED